MYLKYIEVDTIDYIVLQEEEISDIDMIYCCISNVSLHWCTLPGPTVKSCKKEVQHIDSLITCSVYR